MDPDLTPRLPNTTGASANLTRAEILAAMQPYTALSCGCPVEMLAQHRVVNGRAVCPERLMFTR